MRKVFAWSVATGAAVTTAVACDLCSVYNAPLAQHVFEPGPNVGVAEQFTRFDTLQHSGHEVPNDVPQWLNSSISQVAAGYQFTGRFGLQFNLPVIYRSWRRPEGFQIQESSTAGIGDASLLADFVAFRHDEKNWSVAWQVLGGVKFPTGSTKYLQEELNEVEVPGAPESAVHGHDITLGSGSYDGLIGTQVYARWQRFFFNGGVQYAIRSTGAYDYRFANDLTWRGGPGYYFIFKEDWTVGLQFIISGEAKGYDELDGERADDTAITALYLGPQFSLSWKGKLGADLGVVFPVHYWNSDLQIAPDYRIQAALFWQF